MSQDGDEDGPVTGQAAPSTPGEAAPPPPSLVRQIVDAVAGTATGALKWPYNSVAEAWNFVFDPVESLGGPRLHIYPFRLNPYERSASAGLDTITIAGGAVTKLPMFAGKVAPWARSATKAGELERGIERAARAWGEAGAASPARGRGWAEATVELGGAIGLGRKVEGLMGKSETLTRAIAELHDEGWTIRFGKASEGTYANFATKEIVIDSIERGWPPKKIVTSIAHEVGHARHAVPYVSPVGLSREEFIAQNVEHLFASEGEAALFNLEVQAEIEATAGRKIAVAGLDGEGRVAAQRYLDGELSREQAQRLIGDTFRESHPSSAPDKTYTEYYRELYGKSWDATMNLRKPWWSLLGK
jgi:hypothetical protein